MWVSQYHFSVFYMKKDDVILNLSLETQKLHCKRRRHNWENHTPTTNFTKKNEEKGCENKIIDKINWQIAGCHGVRLCKVWYFVVSKGKQESLSSPALIIYRHSDYKTLAEFSWVELIHIFSKSVSILHWILWNGGGGRYTYAFL